MTPTSEPLSSIQARIEELNSTIAEKEEQIKARARHVKNEIKEEISPAHMVRRYPLQSAGVVALVGIVVGRALRGNGSSARVNTTTVRSNTRQSTAQTLLSMVGMEVIHSLKEIGLNYLQRHLEKKNQ